MDISNTSEVSALFQRLRTEGSLVIIDRTSDPERPRGLFAMDALADYIFRVENGKLVTVKSRDGGCV